MAYGFQIKDTAGNVILNSASLAVHLAGEAVVPASTSATQKIPFPNIHGNTVMPVWADTPLNYLTNQLHYPRLSWDYTNRNVIVTGAMGVSAGINVYATGSVVSSNPHGFISGEGIISDEYTQLVFIGKAAHISDLVTTVGGYFTFSRQRFRMNLPAGVTKIYTFHHTITGQVIRELNYYTGYVDMICALTPGSSYYPTGDVNTQIYCFAKMSELGPSNANPDGIRIFDGAGSLIFDSGYGRKILRNISTFSAYRPTTNGIIDVAAGSVLSATHAPKTKPAYGIVGHNIYEVISGLSGAFLDILMRSQGTSTFKTQAAPKPGTGGRVAAWSAATGATANYAVIDGADYD